MTRTVVLFFALSWSSMLGCVATVRSGAYVEGHPIYAVDAPYEYSRHPHVHYGGGTAYLINGRWYYFSGGGWYIFGSEPAVLHRHRIEHGPPPPPPAFHSIPPPGHTVPPVTAPPAPVTAPPAK